ncbi:ATP-binding protein [Paenibacillus camelliae]|uniref:ATP-binding protein n=1 Tax=Paenibacillus camelliae TaxID=512410 RepID=UPI00203C8192|nr:ATP-binding protein [Paenibacillus camelliae]MCM3633838.1 ATP-binding protein [Paenibacillus camelliae]
MRRMLGLSSNTNVIQIVTAVILGLVVSFILMSVPHLPKIESKQGILDISQIHISEEPIKLKGEWEFYWQELLLPEDIHDRIAQEGNTDRLINIPSSWNGYSVDDQKLDGTGFATYRMVIQLSEQDSNGRLALRLPTIFHSYKLWVNGERLAEVGEVGRDKSSVTPNLATKLVFFQPENDRVELVMQVANFHHNRGGITKYIELGGSDQLAVRTNLKIAAEMFITASLLVIGIYHLLLFVLRRKDRATLYYGLFTTLFGIRSLLVGEHLMTQVWPNMPWELQFKIEYLVLCSSAYLITMYSDCIYPNYIARWFHLGTRLATGALCIVVLVTPAIVYTKLLLLIGLVVVVHAIYLIIGLVRAALQRVEGALLFLLVSMVAFIATVNDFLYYSEWSPIENSFSLALLVFTIAQMILLSARFTRTAANEERVTLQLQDANNKLTEMNTNLEQLVLERTNALTVAHAELRLSYDQLLLSEQGRKKLLAYITHDLRMPLANMLGYVEAVHDGVKPERNEQYLKYIRDNTIRINRMIEELSFLSHLETGQVAYQMEAVYVTQFIQQFYEQYELVVRDAGLEFRLDTRAVDDLRNMPIVTMDTQRLEQALFNLVSNAMKFTPKGGVVRLAITVDKANDTRHAVISVQDSGIGIPPEQLEQIFDRNYRYARPGMDLEVEGSGLGLAICREIVQAHGGTVWAESDGITGSIFYISLPFIREEGRGRNDGQL